ncbi:MAG: sigma factor-like helix-turn-helix DNA-binding protein [Acidimicrobiia bacterium]
MIEIGSARDAYRAFVEDVGPRLRLALISAFGPDMGAKATADALVWGWEHWERLAAMDTPAAQLYQVGERKIPRMRRPQLPAPLVSAQSIRPALPRALERLTAQQRALVLLMHGYGWTRRDASDTLGINRSLARRYLDQALADLREELDPGLDVDLLPQIRAYASELDEAAAPFEELRPRLPVLVEARRPAGPSGRWALAITAVVIVLGVVAAVALMLEFQ